MRARIAVDVERRLVFTYATNPLTYEQVMDHREQLRRYPGFEPDFHQIISFLDVTDARLSADEVRKLATQPFFGRSSRRALVAANDELFGLSRMFGTYRELAGASNVRVFRGLRDAAAFVQADLALVEQVFASLSQQPA